MSRVNQALSVVVTVRPKGCSYTSPTSKSSKNLPRQPSFTAIRISSPSSRATSLPCRPPRAYPSSTTDAAHPNEVTVWAPCTALRSWGLAALGEREEEAGEDE